MTLNIKSRFSISVTVITNEFIDKYMAAASGEYIKEYLYIMRHGGEEITIPMIADAVNHTESDVARALSYWKNAGVLKEEVPVKQGITPPITPPPIIPPASETACSRINAKEQPKPDTAAPGETCPPDKIIGLAGDEDFSQLLYIAQKYLNKVFSQRDCEVFAYLYDGLHMAAELLEYVVEYCVQSGRNTLRQIEKVAINWHENGYKTVEDAKNNALALPQDVNAVMNAFGFYDRNPGGIERELIDKWFRTYGFTRDLVIEACNRSLVTAHKPSFMYADGILEKWKAAGVRSMEDVRKLDEQHAEKEKAKEYKTVKSGDMKQAQKRRKGQNQFQNFPQRATDYDALVLRDLAERNSL